MKAQINLTLIICFFAGHLFCQVGINNTDPQATLDITATNVANPTNEDGLLIPRISQFPTADPTILQHSMLVFLTTASGTNPPGYYYWNQPTTTWLPLRGTSEGWSLTGNLGTDATTNFIGTTDAQNFIVRTNNNERIRVLSDGNVGIGITGPIALLETGLGVNNFASVKANGANDAYGYLGVQGANGYDGNATLNIAGQEIGVLGVSNGTTSTDNVGVYGYSNTVGVRAEHSVNANWAELGTTDFAGNFNGRVAIDGGGDATGTSGSGALEINNSLRLDNNEIITNSDTRLFINNDNNGDVSMDGNTYYLDASANRVGVGRFPNRARLDVETTAAGEDGLWVQTSGGTNIAATIVNTNGSALTTSATAGFNGISSGSGGIFTNLAFYGSLTAGESGVEGGSQKIGVEGRASNTNMATIDKMGGLFYVSNSLTPPNFTVNALAAVGSVVDGIVYKIFGLGIVSTIVEDAAQKKYIMVAPEAPEALFQDYGVGQLTNGKAIITLDPILTQNILVDEKHPMKVFIQLEGQCNGVFVTNKSARSFEVIELNNGRSNVPFSYQIIANRANETRGGHTSYYANMRFKSFDSYTNER
ncbi:MAG TPA: hypothetical protein EYN07_13475 [Flavobacteriaceae bacterium]|nr:hypothetical protein [Flavobacteriaceae bacterium]HIB49255.1 hypothetical protein [Flavobacteriaceae bacterium]HIO00239.1 hypothetical protein [Flavobacteriaceae bacterium]|tara:strand:+ start:2174 stop:3946 length:1773 start_codon:yes stop_codon:yes gene_type:complete